MIQFCLVLQKNEQCGSPTEDAVYANCIKQLHFYLGMLWMDKLRWEWVCFMWKLNSMWYSMNGNSCHWKHVRREDIALHSGQDLEKNQVGLWNGFNLQIKASTSKSCVAWNKSRLISKLAALFFFPFESGVLFSLQFCL